LTTDGCTRLLYTQLQTSSNGSKLISAVSLGHNFTKNTKWSLSSPNHIKSSITISPPNKPHQSNHNESKKPNLEAAQGCGAV
jgi:hypothetical protein